MEMNVEHFKHNGEEMLLSKHFRIIKKRNNSFIVDRISNLFVIEPIEELLIKLTHKEPTIEATQSLH